MNDQVGNSTDTKLYSSNKKEDAPWFDVGKFKGITTDFLYYVHSNLLGKKIFNDEFRILTSEISNASIDTIKYIYSFKDDYGSYFDHSIRTSRIWMTNKGFLKRDNNSQPYWGTLKMLEHSDDFTERVIYFLKFIERHISLKKKIISEGIDTNELKTIKITSPKEVEKIEAIRKLRFIFKRDLEKQRDFLKNNKKINSKTFILGNHYKYPQAAHIVPVYYLYKNRKFNEIADPNNGMFLDPNTHDLFDRRELNFNDKYELVSNEGEIVKFDKNILTVERKMYIDLYIEKFQGKA